MPSTYTVNLGIEKPATGEQSGTWGDTTNVNFDILDQAINGAERVTLTSAGSSGSPNALNITNGATSDGRNKWIEFYSSGDLGGSVYVQLVPNDAEKIVFVRNSLASSRSILLFQGTYNSGRDLEIPAGVDMVVKFDGGGASAATVTDVFTKLRATEITTPTLTATTADINGGTIDNSVIGGSTAAAVTGTAVVANTSLNIAGDGATVTGIKDEDNMASNSATKLATQQSIKAYVDSQVGTVDTWAEVLANGATSGSTNPEVTAGQALKTNTINETSAGSGVTIDSVLLKDDVVNATDVETASISANDGTPSATIANTTGNFTITNFISNSVDIGGGAIDGTNIGASSAGTGAFTTLSASGDVNVDSGVLFVDASANEIGINTTSPASALHAKQSGNGTSSTYAATIENPTATAANALGLTIDFSGSSGNWTNGTGGDFITAKDGLTQFRVTGAGGIIANAGSTITTGNNDAQLTLISTDADASVGPRLDLYRNSSSPANGDVIGEIQFQGEDTVGSLNIFAAISSQADQVNNGAEDGSLRFKTLHNGTLAERITIAQNNHVIINETGVDADFRVESDGNTHMLFVDGSQNAVGINDSSPSGVRLTVLGVDTAAVAWGDTSKRGFLSFDGGGAPIVRAGSGLGLKFQSNGTRDVAVFGTSESVFNEPGNNQDFRVESDANTHALFVDGGNNRVDTAVPLRVGFNEITLNAGTGILQIATATSGTDTLWTDINDGTNSYSSMPSELAIMNSADNTTNSFAGIFFQAGETSSGSEVSSARIGAVRTGAFTTDLAFATRDSSGMLERFRIASDGAATFSSTVIANSEFRGAVVAYSANVDAPYLIAGTAGYTGATTNWNTYGIQHRIKTNSGGTPRVTIDNNVGEQWSLNASGGMILTPSGTDGHAIFNEGGIDIDFRVESDGNANMLFVDGGNNRVGIGSTGTIGGTQLNVLGTAGTFNQVAVGSSSANNSITIGNHTANDVVSDLITSSSKFGGLIQGGDNGNLVLGIRDNDSTDGLFVISGAGDQTTNDYSRLRLSITPSTFIVNESGVDADFRVESDGNANMLFVDGGNNRVAVGSTGVTGSHFTVAASTNTTIVLDGDSYSTWVQDAEWNSLLLGGAYYDSGAKFAVTNRGASQINIGHDGNATPSLQGFIFSSASAGGSAGTAPPFENLASITRAGTVFNEDSHDRDFRVESDGVSNMLQVDAASNAVGIRVNGDGNQSLKIKSTGSTGNLTLIEDENINGAYNPSYQYKVAYIAGNSSNNQLTIPFLARSYNQTGYLKVRVLPAIHNIATAARVATFEFALTMAYPTTVSVGAVLSSSGNYASVTNNTSNQIIVTFSTAYTNATQSGAFIHVEFFGQQGSSGAVDWNNIAFN
jgi:hypothetical protein